MSRTSRFAPAIVVPLAGALALAAPQASAMTAYSPAAQHFAAATSPQPVDYRYHHWGRHYYGGGAAFAAMTLGMIGAIAAASAYDDCGWGVCGDYDGYYGGPYYGGPYYGGGWGHRHWGGWGGHPGGGHHAYAAGGPPHPGRR